MAILTKGLVKGAHWYTRLGEALHRVMKTDGSGDRATTLKDARRLLLLPSVTGVVDILAKPQLERWKMKQVALATLRTPKMAEESEDYWCTRVTDTAFEQVEQAADLGTAIHDALEGAVADLLWDREKFAVYVEPVLDYIKKEGLVITAREKKIVNPEHGFAGTADVFFTFDGGKPGILDYKTKRTKKGEKVEAYDEHRLQLAAYAATEYGVEVLPEVRSINVFVSSTEPGRVEFIEHKDLLMDWYAFRSLAGIWRYLKGYDPRFERATV